MRLQCRLLLNLFSLWGIKIEEIEEESLPRRPFVHSGLFQRLIWFLVAINAQQRSKAFRLLLSEKIEEELPGLSV